MSRRRCAACGKPFRVRPQVPDQTYCSAPACQRERKKLWQRNRRRTDPDYRDNQARAQQAWAARNPGYWRQYRARNPQYTQGERSGQSDRPQEGPDGPSMPAASVEGTFSLRPGVYRLSVLEVEGGAKMDASFIVELVPLRASRQK